MQELKFFTQGQAGRQFHPPLPQILTELETELVSSKGLVQGYDWPQQIIGPSAFSVCGELSM